MAEVVPALREGAELAAVGADVGVVDVAVDDVASRCRRRAWRAARRPPGTTAAKSVPRASNRATISASSRRLAAAHASKTGASLGDASLCDCARRPRRGDRPASPPATQPSSPRTSLCAAASHQGAASAPSSDSRQPRPLADTRRKRGAPLGLTPEPARRRRWARTDGRRSAAPPGPYAQARNAARQQELRVDRQALDQRAAGGCGGALQVGQMRPGRLGVDVVGRHRRHAAPVVDAGARPAAPGRRAAGWAAPGCSCAGPKHESRHRDRPERAPPSVGSAARAMRVPGLARKFWMITSWMWP